MAGLYYLSVSAQDATGTQVSAASWYGVAGALLTQVSLAASPASPQSVNTPITLIANATGGTDVSYQFWAYAASTQSWSRLPSSSSACTWTPATAGCYYLTVSAQDGVSGTVVSNAAWYNVSSLTALTLGTSPTSPQPANTGITLTATASGGSSLTYQFWCYSAATGTWSQLQAFSSSNTITWTPSAIGSYFLTTTAQDGSTGQQMSASLWYIVSGPVLTAVSLATAPVSPQLINTPVTLTATATGGTNVQYQFWAYSAAMQSWSQLQALTASPTCTWTAATAGCYYLRHRAGRPHRHHGERLRLVRGQQPALPHPHDLLRLPAAGQHANYADVDRNGRNKFPISVLGL